jgi:tetratricopeptide (TPR) repeat protein
MPETATQFDPHGDEARGTPSEPASPSLDPALPPAAGGRYQFLDEIARGGMGVVYRVTDTVLGREVAVKVLDNRFDAGSAAARRFVDEARVTGQLQHPSIPAVHDLGSLPDGRPFLAMKLVKGRTLDQDIKNRPDPAHDRGRFVAIFEQVCHAIGFAHEHQVLHRDLKPANVMVGGFGEVQVMDWGLAKVLTASGRAHPGRTDLEATVGTEIRTTREQDSSCTQAGTMLGTPAYMPPEQAGGEIDRIDERADVFGLGAILAVILTGQPPYAGKDSETIRLMAVRGQLADCLGRLDGCGAEPGLVALAKRCLAFDPDERPRNAGVVAKEVAGLRAAAEQRARVAELEQAKAEGQATEARKKRRVQLALAALAVLVTVGAAVVWSIDQQRRATALAEVAARRDRTTTSVTAALDEARARTAEAWGLTNYPERMLVASNFATAAVRRAEGFMATGEPTDELRAEMDAVRAETDDLGRHARLFAELTRIHAEHAEGRLPGSAQDRARVSQKMADAFRAFGLDVLVQPADEVVAAVLASRAREKLLGFLAYRRFATGNPEERRRLDAVLRTACHSAGGLLARWQDISNRNDAPALLELAASPEAMTLSIEILDDLHRQLERTGRVQALLELLRRACDRYPDFVWFRQAIASLCLQQKPLAHEAVQHAAVMPVLRPNSPFCHYYLGRCLLPVEAYSLAVKSFRKSIELNPDYPHPHYRLGTFLASGKDLSGVDPADLKAIHTDPRYARTHVHRGMELQAKGDLESAVAAYKCALRLDGRLGLAHFSLGFALREKGDLDGADVAFRNVIKLASNNPWSHRNLGIAFYHQWDYVGAAARYREVVRLDPKHAQFRAEQGMVLRAGGDIAGAIASCREAVRLDTKLPRAHYELGSALRVKGDLDKAIACYQEAIRLDPKYDDARNDLRLAERWRVLLPRLADVAAGRVEPATPSEGCELALLCTQLFQKRYAAAVRLYRKAFAAEPKLADDLGAFHRYNAACAAALAGCGSDIDASSQPQERAVLRQQALDWLRADRALMQKKLTSGKPADRMWVARQLSHWLADADLAGVRPGARREGLSSEEKAEWDRFWAEVQATRDEARKAPPRAEKIP